MAEMTEPRELFMHELGDILYAERVLVKALPKLEKEASDRELADSFKAHQAETEQHVTNLEKAFKELGEKAKAEKCPGMDGIKEEHDQFVKEQSPSPEVLDAFLTGAGARTEHYEIAAYEGLINSAEAMGEDRVAKLLSENLAQEKEALQKMKTINKRLARASAKDVVRS
jgi:ferritin-like metal-binding protein YciE